MQHSPSRRRFIRIIAAAPGLALLPALARGADADRFRLRIWRGEALGADAMLQIHHPDPAVADRLIAASVAEVERLERVFSLYRPESALVRLNRLGRLDDAPSDLVRLLGESEAFSRMTNGAFDATVQPLWDLYAAHFSAPDADPRGPDAAAIAGTLTRIGHGQIELNESLVRFRRSGMGVTLNGIAQGYITDRVVDRLRPAGIAMALVDMGETSAIGGHPEGGPWSVGLEDPALPGQIAERIALSDQAIATSGGYGTQFDPAGRFNHLFDPSTGRTSSRYLQVSVIAPNATMADALSTAFSMMKLDSTKPIVERLGLTARFVLPDGSRLIQTV